MFRYVCLDVNMHTRIRQYVCMHVCIYACMHVCMYACMDVCTSGPPSRMCEASLEHEAWSGRVDKCLLRSGAVLRSQPCRRATSERCVPHVPPPRGPFWVTRRGADWASSGDVGLQRVCVWRSRVGWRRAALVNLVAGGQSGCGATWPVLGGRALFS